MKTIRFVLLIVVSAVLAGCASTTTLKAPCPNFGKSCDKAPINSWNSGY